MNGPTFLSSRAVTNEEDKPRRSSGGGRHPHTRDPGQPPPHHRRLLRPGEGFRAACPHAILEGLARRGVRGRLRYYMQHRRDRIKFQQRRSSFQEQENGTSQADVLSNLLFNLLMEQLVALPFLEATSLLSYADALALVVTGEGSKRSIPSAGSARSWGSTSRPRSPGP